MQNLEVNILYKAFCLSLLISVNFCARLSVTGQHQLAVEVSPGKSELPEVELATLVCLLHVGRQLPVGRPSTYGLVVCSLWLSVDMRELHSSMYLLLRGSCGQESIQALHPLNAGISSKKVCLRMGESGGMDPWIMLLPGKVGEKHLHASEVLDGSTRGLGFGVKRLVHPLYPDRVPIVPPKYSRLSFPGSMAFNSSFIWEACWSAFFL